MTRKSPDARSAADGARNTYSRTRGNRRDIEPRQAKSAAPDATLPAQRTAPEVLVDGRLRTSRGKTGLRHNALQARPGGARADQRARTAAERDEPRAGPGARPGRAHRCSSTRVRMRKVHPDRYRAAVRPVADVPT